MREPSVLIVDLGSQYTLVIARTLREIGVRSAVLSPTRAQDWLKQNKPRSIILSGGPSSVYDTDAPSVPSEVWNARVPILGICYGMQYIAKHCGVSGKIVHTSEHSGYGQETLILETNNTLFDNIEVHQSVWASHGDTVSKVPANFVSIGTTTNGAIAALYSQKKNIWGVQFHPEVVDTSCGKQILSNFVFSICKCKKDWVPNDIVKTIRTQIREEIGGQNTIIGFSGGVDSATLTSVLAPVLGTHLHALCIDGGQLREGELEEIKSYASSIGISLTVVDARNAFQKKLRNVVDAEKKRSAFREVYLDEFRKFAKQCKATCIVQGSLATDFIESGATGGAKIKTHHNIGLKWGDLKEVHPFRDLFKYEVRALAYTLELPQSLVTRQPFPGPGLFIRILGAPTLERLDIVRWANSTVANILKKAKYKKTRGDEGSWYDYVSQLVVALQTTPTVGVKGDARIYAYSVYVRAIKTVDFMTAEGIQFPSSIRKEISRRVTQHPDIVHVMFAETDKPPATTEFE